MEWAEEGNRKGRWSEGEQIAVVLPICHNKICLLSDDFVFECHFCIVLLKSFFPRSHSRYHYGINEFGHCIQMVI